MSNKAINWAWEIQGLSPVERLVLLAIADHADESHSSYPGQELLARRSCCSVRTVQRVLPRLEELGILSRVRRYVEGGRTSDRYVLRVGYTPDCHLTSETSVTAIYDERDRHQCQGNPQNPQNPQVPPIVPQPEGEMELQQPGFDDWWAVYPLKKDKGAARRAFTRAVKKVSVDVIVAAASAYRDDPNRDPRFTKYPASWLNAEAWENGPLPQRASTSGGTAVERMLHGMRSAYPAGGEHHAIGQ